MLERLIEMATSAGFYRLSGWPSIAIVVPPVGWFFQRLDFGSNKGLKHALSFFCVYPPQCKVYVKKYHSMFHPPNSRYYHSSSVSYHDPFRTIFGAAQAYQAPPWCPSTPSPAPPPQHAERANAHSSDPRSPHLIYDAKGTERRPEKRAPRRRWRSWWGRSLAWSSSCLISEGVSGAAGVVFRVLAKGVWTRENTC